MEIIKEALVRVKATRRGSWSGQELETRPVSTSSVEFTVEELAEIMGEELQLPRIEPKGSEDAKTLRYLYKGIAKVGPESLRHFKRTYRQALKRTISAGAFNPARPVIVPIKDDKRYRTFVPEQEPRSAAVIIYMMDVSGSMGKEQKEIVRAEPAGSMHGFACTMTMGTSSMMRPPVKLTGYSFVPVKVEERSSQVPISWLRKSLKSTPLRTGIFIHSIFRRNNWSQADTKVCLELLKNIDSIV